MKYLYLLLFLPFAAISQHHHNCKTVSPKGTEKQSMEQQLRQAAFARSQSRTTNSGMTCIPIKVHDVLDGSGGGGVDKTALNRSIANLNYYFKPANIEFYICGISTYNNATYYDFDDTEESSLKGVDPPVTNAFNMYLVNSIDGAAGYAYFPNNSVTSTTSFIDKNVLDGYPNGTIVHEFGHHFSLYHTHDGTENGNTDPEAENVPRSGANSNCTGKGDLLCDTEADPRGSTSNCVYTGGGLSTTDINGVAYTPPVENIMSYYSDACGGDLFTAGQYGRIMSALSTRLAHSAYSLNCTAATIAAASGLTATYTGSNIELNWADNASNEAGYLIERSETSASSGFEPLVNGGVADGVTAFTDNGPESYKTYYYRVKASNGNCNTYSNVATVTTGAIYCTPAYSQGCQSSYISDFIFTGNTTLSNTSTGCPSGAYTNYSQTMTAEVTAGQSYNVSVKQFANFNRSIHVYCDFNRDGDFDDAGETLISGASLPSSPSSYSSNVTIPASAYNGTSLMRVVAYNPVNNPSPTPCGNFVFGESEDYALVISGGIVSGTTSSSDIHQVLTMVPNPSSGKTELKLWSDESLLGNIRIVSLQGDVQQTIEHAFQYGENSIELDLSGLQSGVYLVETTAGNISKVARLFKY